ncbi:putative Diguanylate cyclase [Beijerinckiaceae bacterium RH AL1]|nr:putative Diguanylate cyclase [Beijerinckiaceae bacterium RH CH11]VVB46540.1 putative Diguanylate cyclase [Beijerinckiaceae bacterium RH AL8]VVC55383.1 putative Diguanylate cyclase [Beijerinckiaceae bacterium RH AL1]
MIWASTREGSITYAGPEWTAFTGQPLDAAMGDGWLEMLHAEDRDSTQAFFKKACASMAAFTVEYRLHPVDEAYVRVVAGATPSISPVDHSFIGYLGTLNEIEGQAGVTRNILGKAIIAPPSKATTPLTSVDIIADYLLLARATAQHAGEERLLASLDFAISEVMRRLGYRTAEAERH